jgi:hypothetical protein
LNGIQDSFRRLEVDCSHTWRAEDQYKVISLTASVAVPAGSFTNCLETQETTVLEPGVVDHKYYVKGIGQVSETTVKGPKETSLLVSYK